MIVIANRGSRRGLGLMLLTVMLALGGCISAHKLDQALAVPVGMNKVQVVNKLGEPPLRDRQDDGTERWIWARDGQFGHESVTLIMKDDRVSAIETEGERLKHLEEMERLRQIEERLQGKSVPPSVAVEERPVARETFVFRAIPPSAMPQSSSTGPTNIAPAVVVDPPAKPGKSSDEMWREQAEGLADAQRQARSIEERTRELVEKAFLEKKAADEAKGTESEQDVPQFTAWYMARQLVNDYLVDEKKLAGKRRLFPNPRFARDSTGEERLPGNNWRTWGYVDTVDASNAPIRYQWTAELEYHGTKWTLKKLAVGEKENKGEK